MKQLFIDLITRGSFQQALDLSKKISDNDIELTLVDESCNKDNIAVFVYAWFIFRINKTLKAYDFAAGLLEGFSCLKGAYAAEYGYLDLAQKHGLSELDFWKRNYFFYMIPDRIVNGAEARFFAKKILLAEPDNKIGLKTLGLTAKYEGKRLRKPGKDMPAHRKFKLFVRKGRFSSAFGQVSLISSQVLTTILVNISSKKNITAYAFLLELILERETCELHLLAAHMFTVDLNHRNGSAGVAFFHLYRAAELEPNNFEIQEKLLKLRQFMR